MDRYTIVIWQEADHERWELTTDPDHAHPGNQAADIDSAVEAAMATLPADVQSADIDIIVSECEDHCDQYGWVRLRCGKWSVHRGHR